MRLAVVYGREIDGKETTFGTTGYTYNRTFLLYDRRTESVWYPLENGEMNAISGPLQGKALQFLEEPDVIPLKEWRARYPETLVLIPS